MANNDGEEGDQCRMIDDHDEVIESVGHFGQPFSVKMENGF